MARPGILLPPLFGNVYSVTQRCEFVAQKIQFGMFYQQNNALGTFEGNVLADENAIFTFWQAVILPVLRPILSAGTKLTELRVWCLTWNNQATQIYSQGQFGTSPGDPLPPQIAYCIKKQTKYRGRASHGRMYLGGMSEDDSTNGAPVPAFTALAATFAAALQNGFTDGPTGRSFLPVVVNLNRYYFDSVTHPAPPGTPEPVDPPQTVHGAPILKATAPLIWNTQRPRTIGRGE